MSANQKINYVEIDQDILNSLYGFYFRDIKSKFSASVNRAYGDFCRTIDFPKNLKKQNKENENFKKNLKNEVAILFEREINSLIKAKEVNKEFFDKRHNELCEEIIKIYADNNIALTYGQAQKWVNMSIKYLYCLQYNDFKNVFQFLHIPVDNYILKRASKKFKIKKPINSWSKWNKEEYINYQEKLINAIENKEDPLRWEFHAWLNEAKN